MRGQRQNVLAALVMMSLAASAGCTSGGTAAAPRARAARPVASAAVAASPAASRAPNRPGFTLAVTGDLLAHQPVVAAARAAAGGAGYDFRPLLVQVRPILSRADLAICHLETPLSPDDRVVTYYPDFQAPKELAPAIRWAGFDTCTTASNHTLDDGPAGVRHTLDLLDAAGVRHAGMARSAAEAARAQSYTVDGFHVAHLDYSYGLNGRSVPVDQPWLVSLIDAPRILRDARAVRSAGADFVLVSLHWGQEYQSAPTEAQRALARQLLASADIDLILGSHTHVVQPVERINGKYVVYGMGNFLARHAPCCDSPPTFDGVIVHVVVEATAGRLRVTALTYTPTMVDPGTLVVVPVAAALAAGAASPSRAELMASWRRTVARMDSLDAAGSGVVPDDPPPGLPTR